MKIVQILVKTFTHSAKSSFLSKDFIYRWLRLLKQQSSITVYRSPTKENKLLFSVSVLHQTNGNLLSVFRLQEKTQVAVFVSSVFLIYKRKIEL